jgi:hypothetical protein
MILGGARFSLMQGNNAARARLNVVNDLAGIARDMPLGTGA